MREVYPELKVYFNEYGTHARYCSDLFLKSALSKKPDILLRLCEDLSHKKIKSITIHNAHLPVLSRANKQMGLDFYIEDDQHCCYNLEFQNYDLTINERICINYYAQRIMIDQIHRGKSYKDVPQCYQAIYYLGNPLPIFNGFVDDYLKRVGSTGLPYDGENLISKIYTINCIDEQIEGKSHLTFTEQLSYLLLYDVPYPYEEPDELIKEVIQMLREFNEEDRARWEIDNEEDQQRIFNTEIEEIKEKMKVEIKEQSRKEKDIEYFKTQADILRSLIKAKFKYVSPYIEKHIIKVSFEALCNAIIAVSNINNPDDLIPILQS